MSVIVTCATDIPGPDGTYCTKIVHLPAGATTVPFAQVPPVIEKAPWPAKTVTTLGAAVRVNEPAFAPVAVLVTVMVPVTAAVLGVIALNNDGVMAEKLTVATPVVPVVPVSATAPASVEGPPFLGWS